MKKFILLCFLSAAIVDYVEAVICWTCETEPSNDACQRNGRLQACQANQGLCQNEVRQYRNHLEVSKRCKQRLACDNNELQNSQYGIGAPPLSQCTFRGTVATCRCCCGTNLCNNKLGVDCFEPPPLPDPTCVLIPTPPSGSKVCTPAPKGREASIGTTCRFSCKEGYALYGFRLSTCKKRSSTTARFSRPRPYCRRSACDPPRTAPENGDVTCTNSNNANSVCTYTCDAGYAMRGFDKDTTTCYFNNAWSNPHPPECLPVQCTPSQTSPRNGNVKCTNFNLLGSVCSFTCLPGYLLEGKPETTCLASLSGRRFGRWSNRPPTCKRVRCNPPHQDPANGRVTCSNTNEEGSVCSFTCTAGYFLNGTPQSTCVDDQDGDDDGVWNAPAPTCVRITCLPVQVAPQNGGVTCSNENFFLSSCSFSCSPGYFLSGNRVTVCADDEDGDADGEWSLAPPTCVRITCEPRQTNPTNGDVSCTNENNLNSVCSFACQEGFAVVGARQVTCQNDFDRDSDGVWSAAPPTCEPVTCNPPHSNPERGSVTCTSDNNYGSECSFQCDAGYALIGSATSTCQDDRDRDTDGVWSTPAPICVRIQCVPPHTDPRNGNVDCTDANNERSVCTFTCNFGYFLTGIPESTCRPDSVNSRLGEWSSDAPTCRRVVCLPPRTNPRNGRVRCTNGNQERSVCSFTCNTNYNLAGPFNNTCTDDGDGDEEGLWDANPPVCERVTCRPPRVNPANGQVRCSSGNNAGSTCRFTCNEGYIISDTTRSRAVCRDDRDGDSFGDWSQEPPTCIRITCDPPRTNPVNGAVDCSNSNNYNSICSYTCNGGFFLNGSPAAICQDDGDGDAQGEWNATAPTCIRITCNPPRENPTDGTVACSRSNNFASDCRYQCNPGYFLDGATNSICQDDLDGDADGVWSTNPPRCVRITCNPPRRNPTNGRVTCSNRNNLNSECDYICNAGYFLNGAGQTTCVDDNNNDAQGIWNNPPPTCSRIICNPVQRAPANGEVDCTDANNENSVCTFACDTGYNLSGSSSVTCEDDKNGDNLGQWTGPAPTCIRITCPPPHRNPTNGSVSCTSGNNAGSECSFTCNAGFFLNGSPISTCQDDGDFDFEGVWTSPAPTCDRIFCPPPHTNPDNGNVDCTDGNFYQSDCRFTCDNGYFLEGSSRSVCNDDGDNDVMGMWSSNAPVCVQITCPEQRDPTNGTVTCDNANNFESDCTFTCNAGFFLDGFGVTVCIDDSDNDADGVWLNPSPTCVQITCDPPRTSPDNGAVTCSNNNNFNSQCDYTCNAGYFLNGAGQTTCVDDNNNDAQGIWNNPPPTCSRIICNPVQVAPANGRVNCDNANNEDSVCEFTCNAGYVLSGSPSTVCRDDEDNDNMGLWSNAPPTCLRITCPPPHQNPTNGSVSCSDFNNAGSECSFTCNAGFFLNGSPISNCRDDGNNDQEGVWTSPAPTCDRIFCPPPHTNPDNGNVDCTDGNFYQSDCRFTCNPGYFRDGSSQSICNDDGDNDVIGAWSSNAPVCLKIQCDPMQSDPANGAVTCDDVNNLGSTCTFTCNLDNGYVLSGEETTICQDDNDNDADGVWTNPAPICNRITCNPPRVNPGNGSVSCSDSNFFNSECDFTCNDGFALSGEPSTICLFDDQLRGVWTNDPPICVGIICNPAYTSLENGGVDCSDFNSENSVCTFTCNAGYVLSGSPETVCRDDNNGDNFGQWSNAPPTCLRITCPPPHQNPTNGSVSCSDLNNAGSECSFTCNAGFFLNGSLISTCRDDGNNDQEGVWTSPAPTCDRIFCPPPHANPDNGNVDCTDGNFYQSDCRFTCNAGYFRDGSSQSICNDDGDNDVIGAWSSNAPVCLKIQCDPMQSDPANGAVTCDDVNNLGSTCTFTCNVDNGYVLSGEETTICQDDNDNDADGVWTNPAPICNRITCNPPRVNPGNGSVSCSDSNFFNSECDFTCNEGFALTGEPSTTCLFDDQLRGVWTNDPPICVGIICNPAYTSLENGGVDCSDFNNENSVCTSTCNAGYFLIGEPSATCVDDNNGDNLGQWSAPLPLCTQIRCQPEQRNPANGLVDCSNGNLAGSECSFTCNPNYYRDGVAQTTCIPDVSTNSGSWNAPAPLCRRITCLPPYTVIGNGTVGCSQANNAGSVCEFACNENYRLEGPSNTATCNDDGDGDPLGVWTHPLPTCTPIACEPEYTRVVNGRIECTNRNFLFSECAVTCDSDDFFLDGSPEPACFPTDNQEQGIWTDELATCTRKACEDPPGAPENGFMVCTNANFFGSQCEYGCNDYHTRVGPLYSTCIDTGDGRTFIWDNPAPICRPNICPPQRINNGQVTCDDQSLIASTECTFTCNERYGLFPESVTGNTCLNDTTWSIQPPCCAQRCPPFALMDLVIVLDSSTSINEVNWISMLLFVTNVIELFEISPTGTQIGLFRYNATVDTSTQILLDTYANDKAGLIAAVEGIHYGTRGANLNGTRTGLALRHARSVTFARGNRSEARDVVLLLTDGRAQDDVRNAAAELRAAGATIYVIGIYPPFQRLDRQELLDIAGDPTNVFLATQGFAQLDEQLANEISKDFCPLPCTE